MHDVRRKVAVYHRREIDDSFVDVFDFDDALAVIGAFGLVQVVVDVKEIRVLARDVPAAVLVGGGVADFRPKREI